MMQLLFFLVFECNAAFLVGGVTNQLELLPGSNICNNEVCFDAMCNTLQNITDASFVYVVPLDRHQNECEYNETNVWVRMVTIGMDIAGILTTPKVCHNTGMCMNQICDLWREPLTTLALVSGWCGLA